MSEIACKKLLMPTGGSAEHFFRSDWTLNLYHGCNHGCIYCDSRSVCYHLEDFDRVRVKHNGLALLERELRAKKTAGVVSMGAASDAYNRLEESLGVSRAALELLLRYGFGVMIPTKSKLIVRDAALLGDIAKARYACVAFSLTTADTTLAAFLEPGAPPPSARFAAMEALAKAGVFTGTWMNPMLPFLTDTAENIRAVLTRTADAGGRFAICHFGVTLREGDREYFYRALDGDLRFAGLKARYSEAFGLRYLCATPDAQALSDFLTRECDRLGLLSTFSAVNRAAGVREPVQTRLV
ncbi:MAG TPA: radical SAM protein [Candidatus Limiplasma sp.]|nr:radical SAM protein [Candidatus Limiplasma sp.]